MAWSVNQEFDKNKAENHGEGVLGIMYMIEVSTKYQAQCASC